MLCQIKARDKRDKYLSRLPACRSCTLCSKFLQAGGRFRLSPGQSGWQTGRLANVPFVIQRPCHLTWEGLRPVSGGVF
jgi:hypothetical protein